MTTRSPCRARGPSRACPCPLAALLALVCVSTAEAQTSPRDAATLAVRGSLGSPTASPEIAKASADAVEAAVTLGVTRAASGAFVVGGLSAARASSPTESVATVSRSDTPSPEALGAADDVSVATVSRDGAELASLTRKERRPRSASTLPWVGVDSIEPPFPELDVESELRLPAWDLLGPPDRIGAPPSFVSVSDGFDLDVPPPKVAPLELAVSRVIRRKYYSEVRRFMKRSWNEYYLNTPTLRYMNYLEVVDRINQIGRDDFGGEIGHSEQAANEWRDDILGRSDRQGESDFEIVHLGPLVFMDSGSVRLDVGRMFRSSRESEDTAVGVEAEGGDEPAIHKPILALSDYRFGTSFRLSANPLKIVTESDPTWLITRYGVAFEVSWLSDVLGREIATTEFEVEWERDGDFAAIVNFVFESR